MRRSTLLAALLIAMVTAATALGGEPKPLQFWHTQAQENAELLQKIVDDYNATDPPIPVVLVYSGGYSALFRKVRVAIPTGKLPDLVVAYESMVAEYIQSDAVVPLDPYIHDPEIGLSKESLADIFPSILENNRYAAFGNKFYTFPFTKSVLMFYYNLDLIRKAGFEKRPETWTEFAEQCLAMKKKLGKEGYAISVDASTVDGMIMSYGGQIVTADGRRALFDKPPAVQAFTLIHDLCRQGGAYQIDRENYGDRKDFASQNCAFFLRSSTTRPFIQGDIQGRFDWDMGVIPHGEGVEPVTVLFGANVAVMKTGDERQRAAWQFVKYFASTPVTARWSIGTGYLPVRRSAADRPEVKAFFATDRSNRRAFDALEVARAEPGVLGWQEARGKIEEAASDAIGGRVPPEQIARRLNEQANAILARHREGAAESARHAKGAGAGRGTGGHVGTFWLFLGVVGAAVAIGVAVSLVRSARTRREGGSE
ncbi:MAG: ABC transporter substrate-binding protein [Planctomycetota bacterium]